MYIDIPYIHTYTTIHIECTMRCDILSVAVVMCMGNRVECIADDRVFLFVIKSTFFEQLFSIGIFFTDIMLI